MFFSKLLIPTLRESPTDTDIISAKLMIKSGMIRKLASGFYEFLPLGLKVLRKIENIIRHEMNIIGGQEIILPLISPKNLWIETGRWNIYGKELFRLKDRKNAEFCLAPTAEEVIVDLVRKDVRSYKQLPIMLYQFGPKFRDEIRPRFGVMRSREFLMKDAYSFHTDELDLEKYYRIMLDAYKNICVKCGFKFCVVESTSGPIGGSLSHEFMILAENGETEVALCKCGYSATSEKTECLKVEGSMEELHAMDEIFTPNASTIENVVKFLELSTKNFLKTIIYIADGDPVVVLLREDHEINETKLQTLLEASEIMIADEQTVSTITNASIDFGDSVGFKNINVIADLSVIEILNAVSEANKKDYHVKNINYTSDYGINIIADVRKVVPGDICPRCKEKELKFLRGIEVGHIFKLTTKYSKSMNATYLDSNGKENLIFMGCYGLGVTRIVAATVEQSHDDSGIIWPDNITPFEVLIVPLDYYDDRSREVTEKIYKELSSKGLDVLVDDRNERPGVKFKDADLIGIPYRITIGKKDLANGNVEFKVRKDPKGSVKFLKPEEVVSKVLEIFKK